MKNFWLVICLLVSLKEFEVLGAVQNGIYKRDDYPGKCVIDDDTILDEGQSKTVRSCKKAICGENGRVQFYTCGVQVARKPCYLGELQHPDEPYPRCCLKQVHCSDSGSAEK